MTNEEAIKECVKIQAFGVSERQVEAMEMAIKALKQEPCGNAIDRAEAIRIASGYCHPANVAKELAKLPAVNLQEPVYCDRNICIQNEYNGIGCEDCEVAKSQKLCEDTISRQAVLDEIRKCRFVVDAIEKIRGLPPVTLQPKTGHWIGDAIQGEINGQIVKGFTCSKCGAISVFRMTGGKIVNDDLCPNCGARMIEPQAGKEQ